VNLAPVTESQLADEVARFRLIAAHVPAWIALYNADDNRCIYANRAYVDAFGFTEQSVLGLTYWQVIGDAAQAEISQMVERLRAGESTRYERRLQTADGRWVWIEGHLIPQFDAQGRVIAGCVMMNDITHFREAQRIAAETETRLQKFLDATVEGIVFHVDGIITDVNPPLCALVGYAHDEVVGRPTLDFVPPDERPKVADVIRSGAETRYESAILHRDGTRVPVEFIVRTLERDGERQRMSIVRDLRDRQAAQQRIHFLAHHDPLTGLYNRTAFMEHLDVHLRRAERHNERLALLFIDLDNFKRVNDSLGHTQGDQVLITVADRLTAALRTSDVVGRFGGDEFMVLLPDVERIENVRVVLDALLNVVEVPVRADGRALTVTPSIGVAMFPEHGRSAAELIQHADTAMYGAKRQGRAGYEFFDSSQGEAIYAELVLESELSVGLTRGEFELFFQPQVDAKTGKLAGAEALLRWRHPTRGLLSPDAFISVAEQHRLMLPLGQWVLREAARQTVAWRKAGLAEVPIAVNLARMQFNLEGFAFAVEKVLADTGARGEWLELELTERLLIDDIDHAPDTLRALRRLGFSIAVDDFGVGYTSLAHLTELPLDKLKIDQSFVAGLPTSRRSIAVTQAVVQMALGLGLKVTAEGVQNQAQKDLLESWGCHMFQGSLIGSPMPADEFAAWARRHA
jgi:diguanylate cyclase (GGDEF)-like protein/PAS domain S-box-containing protein